MSTTVTTYAPYPPTTTTLMQGESITNPDTQETSWQLIPITSGTITHIHCDGAIDATLYASSGVYPFVSPPPQLGNPGTLQAGFDLDVNIPFSNGAPTIVQRTPSSIVLTLA